MCMTPAVNTPKAPVVPESVKRVAKDQRRTVAGNNAAATQAASATQTAAANPLAGLPAQGQKKSLLGV